MNGKTLAIIGVAVLVVAVVAIAAMSGDREEPTPEPETPTMTIKVSVKPEYQMLYLDIRLKDCGSYTGTIQFYLDGKPLYCPVSGPQQYSEEAIITLPSTTYKVLNCKYGEGESAEWCASHLTYTVGDGIGSLDVSITASSRC